MSHGGSYSLVQRDERYDKYFTSLEKLRTRLQTVAPDSPMVNEINKTHNVYFQKSYKPYIPVTSIYNKIKPAGAIVPTLAESGSTIQFDVKSIGNLTSDMCLHVSVQAVTSPKNDVLLRYCAYPGIRLLDNVQLKSDGIIVDEYSPDDVISQSRFEVTSDQREVWDRNMGQQSIYKGSYYNVSHNEYFEYTNGLQTPQLTQPAFDLYIPLQFWFCKDPTQALINSPTTTTQRTVIIDLAQLKYILSAWRVDAESPGGLVRTTLPLANIKLDFTLMVNELCVMPEVYNHLSCKPSVNLIRIHKKIISPVKNQVDNILLDRFKFPTEYMTVRVKSKSLANDPDRWYLSGGLGDLPTQMVRAACFYTSANGNNLVAYNGVDVNRVIPVIKSLSVRAKGIELYSSEAADFYSKYLPSRYGDYTKNRTDCDQNISLINFCLKPGEFDPSGYFNLAAGHEMNLDYTLNDGLTYADYEIVVCISALNFLITNNDHIVLKYAY